MFLANYELCEYCLFCSPVWIIWSFSTCIYDTCVMVIIQQRVEKLDLKSLLSVNCELLSVYTMLLKKNLFKLVIVEEKYPCFLNHSQKAWCKIFLVGSLSHGIVKMRYCIAALAPLNSSWRKTINQASIRPWGASQEKSVFLEQDYPKEKSSSNQGDLINRVHWCLKIGWFQDWDAHIRIGSCKSFIEVQKFMSSKMCWRLKLDQPLFLKTMIF